ncbi:putative toxin-antitoxin system toxin component, PIN family [Runella sp. MFBS21]|uniref:putative toxin-antitoxin system toxin component, PIN family n=1 Tax=Runella sp. MFBS21 TaxID=3034018 RepID=UPI0023F79170|nr:putative toxin-antitoxin system toxin component, PIN family [Runella sp. MFBS21]MDF7816886.1 putative toxin-antitoxin system toxin component, PIN family [Runella sp. MFBS21]
MVRIVLDTNCLLMSVSKRSGYYWLFEMLQQDKLELVVTTEILGEYEEIMGRFYSPVYADLVLNGLLNLPNIVLLNPIYYRWELIKVDNDDNKFVDAYIGSNADVLITYDKHFKELDLISFPKVVRMTIEEFNVFLSS